MNTCGELSKNENVIAIVSKDGKLKSRLDSLNIEVLNLRCLNKAFPVLAARKLARIIDDRNIKVIHMHWGKYLAL